MLSDVQVTFSNGKTMDLVQKAYPLGNFIVAGFSGSVKIGFALLESLNKLLQLPPDKQKTHAWNPVWVANEWSSTAKIVYESQPVAERRLGAQILMVGISPTENLGMPHASQVYIVRFTSPDFKPGFMKKPLSICCIGSGAGVEEYKQVLKEFTNIRSSTIQMEMMDFGGWANALSHTLIKVIREGRYKSSLVQEEPYFSLYALYRTKSGESEHGDDRIGLSVVKLSLQCTGSRCENGNGASIVFIPGNGQGIKNTSLSEFI